jgi:hypothetical protein
MRCGWFGGRTFSRIVIARLSHEPVELSKVVFPGNNIGMLCSVGFPPDVDCSLIKGLGFGEVAAILINSCEIV